MLQTKRHIVQKFYLRDDGRFPNNAFLPVLLYKNALDLPRFFPGRFIVRLFEKNNWVNSWKDNIFHFNHYHSTTHEVMGVYKGSTTVLLGGANGIQLTLEKGDVIIIPAGVSHKNLTPKNRFKCVGAYPPGRDFDMNYGKAEERPAADKNIKRVPLPKTDPVDGKDGLLTLYWKKRKPYYRKKKKAVA